MILHWTLVSSKKLGFCEGKGCLQMLKIQKVLESTLSFSLEGTGGGAAGLGVLTWHPVHRGEHGALHCGVAAAPAALVVEAEGQVLGGR